MKWRIDSEERESNGADRSGMEENYFGLKGKAIAIVQVLSKWSRQEELRSLHLTGGPC